MRRVPDVIDCWFDSGAMPFAQWGYPHQGREKFREQFPADFISEAHRSDPRLVLQPVGDQHAACSAIQNAELATSRPTGSHKALAASRSAIASCWG